MRNSSPDNPFSKFTSHAKNVFLSAFKQAENEKSPQITPEYLLSAMFAEKGCLAHNLLSLNGVSGNHKKTARKHENTKTQLQENTEIRKQKNKEIIDWDTIAGKLDNSSKEIIKKAAAAAAQHNHAYIGTEHLLFGILKQSNLLQGRKERSKISNQLDYFLKSSAQFHDPRLALKFGLAGNKAILARNANAVKKEQREPREQFPALSFFCEELVKKSAEGKLQPVFGREKEIQRVINILLRKSKNNPLLIGEAGVGKTAIIHAVAQKIASGEIVSSLRDKKIFYLDPAMLVAGAIFRGDFEARMKDILDEAKDKRVMLFIDEIHTIVGTGNAPGMLDLANMLKPALAQNELTVIGATTTSEYKKTIEKDNALARRFQPILINEEMEENIFSLIKNINQGYQAHHNISITDGAIRSAIYYSKKYFHQRRLPDKALDLLDEAAASLRSRQAASMEEQEILAIENQIREILSRKNEAVNTGLYEDGLNLQTIELSLVKELGEIKKKISEKADAAPLPKLTEIHIKETVFEILGTETIDEKDINSRDDIKKTLQEKIIGQGHIVEKTAQVIARAQAGLLPKNRPLASFMFLGPSGVGKTQLAKELAGVLFNGNIIRIDMSEFAEPHSVSRLLGAPPGYIGYEEGGFLTEKIKRNPYVLVLFDEIEKAHPQIFNILLQILDEGIITDANSETANFRNSVIILTSNIGTEEFNKKAIGFSENSTDFNPEYKEVEKNVLSALKSMMRPELLNRLDHILTFLPLSKESLKQIARMRLDELAARLKKEKNIEILFNSETTDWLAEKSISDNEGARLVSRVIAEYIEFPIAELILDKKLEDNNGISLDIEQNKIILTLSIKSA